LADFGKILTRVSHQNNIKKDRIDQGSKSFDGLGMQVSQRREKCLFSGLENPIQGLDEGRQIILKDMLKPDDILSQMLLSRFRNLSVF